MPSSAPSRRSRSGWCGRSGRCATPRSRSRCRAAPSWTSACASVLEVIYLVFNEGYAASAGEDWVRRDLCEEALRLGRVLAELAPEEPEVHGLVALMEIQASRLRRPPRPRRRAGAAARPGPRPLGPAADRARAAGAGASRSAAGPARPLRPAGRDRGLPRPRAAGRGDRLGADRRPLRRPRPDPTLPDRRAEPGGRAGHGLRPRRRPRTARPDRGRAGARRLPPAPQRPRRPARESRARPRRQQRNSNAPPS